MEVKRGGIILPDTATKERPEQGKVVAVGEGRWEDGKLVKLSVKKGDVVLALGAGDVYKVSDYLLQTV